MLNFEHFRNKKDKMYYPYKHSNINMTKQHLDFFENLHVKIYTDSFAYAKNCRRAILITFKCLKNLLNFPLCE